MSSGSFIARREISVFTAEGTSRSALPARRPDAVDLLDQPALAVGERHLLDDERDALGLRVHHRRARRVDRTAEHLRQERRASPAARTGRA